MWEGVEVKGVKGEEKVQDLERDRRDRVAAGEVQTLIPVRGISGDRSQVAVLNVGPQIIFQ